jgi:TusA-related sulfurtransferase
MPKGNDKPEGAPEKMIDLRDSHKTVSVKALVQVAEALKFLNEGETIELLTDSYTGLRHDIQAWGRISGNTVHQKFDSKLESTKYDHFVITKAPRRHGPKERMAVVVSKNALDELISPLGFALSAAAAGMEVNIFFQGPAVHILEKGFVVRMHEATGISL